MSLDIFDHPAIQRLVQGEPIPIQDLRQAIVDFWKENGASEICDSCRSLLWFGKKNENSPVTGCCGPCRYLDLDRGCTQRNLMCQTFSCVRLKQLLDRAGVLGSWLQFEDMLEQLEDQDNWDARLPNGALIFLSNGSLFDVPIFRSNDQGRRRGEHILPPFAWHRKIQKWEEKQRKA